MVPGTSAARREALSAGREVVKIACGDHWRSAINLTAAGRLGAAGLVGWSYTGELVELVVDIASRVSGVAADQHHPCLVGSGENDNHSILPAEVFHA